MAKMMIKLSRDEAQKYLPYLMICEARESAKWNTERRKRMWTAEFTEAERKASSSIFSTSHRWALVSGVPETVTMEMKTVNLWKRLGDFCARL